jgi:hypothetical protein
MQAETFQIQTMVVAQRMQIPQTNKNKVKQHSEIIC